MEYYSAIKKNEILPFATTQMDLESIMPSEVSQTEGEDKYSYVITYMWNLKNKANECITKQKQTHGYENKVVFTSGEREGGRGKMGYRIKRHKLLHIK